MTNTLPLGGGGPRLVLSQGVSFIIQPAPYNAWVDGFGPGGPSIQRVDESSFYQDFLPRTPWKSLKALPEALACPCCGCCITSPYSWVIENLKGEAMEGVKCCHILSKYQWGTVRGLPKMSVFSVLLSKCDIDDVPNGPKWGRSRTQQMVRGDISTAWILM